MPRTRVLSSTAGALSTLLLVAATILGCQGDGEAPDPAGEAAEAVQETGPTVGDAIAKLQTQDPKGAAEILEQVTAGDAGNARAWSLLGVARKQQQDFGGALAAYNLV